ncbi:MAG: NAD(P)/FAD-dependent oxidoreductase [Thermoplasmata archaeon]|nr:NAD(P)/FAD-dependent oxidoreductase [Thermoplasmata archaeon]
MLFDIAIVGGGPVGSMIAKISSSRGYKTIVFEEHDEVGIPVRCAGLVSERVIKIHGEGIINKIKGADIVFPNGREIRIGGNRVHAYVINRRIFDKSMAEEAMANGAEYRLEKKVKRINFKNGIFSIEGEKARILIGADGPKSMVAKNFSMGKLQYINAIQGYGKYDMDEQYVKIFLGNDLAPKFFAWIIPAEKARIGLGTTEKNLKQHFKKFLKNIDARVDEITSGLIPIGLRKFVRKKVALAGDAAGQVKATSGGGLYTGLMAAKILANNIENLNNYEKEYMKSIGKELQRCLLLRKIFIKLSDNSLNKFASFVEKNVDLINKYGDIDYPSIVAKQLLKSPFSFQKRKSASSQKEN